MRNLVLVLLLVFIVSSCLMPKDFEPKSIYGETYKLIYQVDDDIRVDSFSIAERLHPKFGDLNGVGRFMFRMQYSSDYPDLLKKFKKMLREENIVSPAKTLGEFISREYSKKFKLKRIGESETLPSSRGYVPSSLIKKYDNVNNVIVVDTPKWSLHQNEWDSKFLIEYVIQYRIYDTETGDLLYGDSCIYESKNRYSLDNIFEENFGVLKEEVKELYAFCKDELITGIDPSKNLTFGRTRVR